jgi:hypothetical protein
LIAELVADGDDPGLEQGRSAWWRAALDDAVAGDAAYDSAPFL